MREINTRHHGFLILYFRFYLLLIKNHHHVGDVINNIGFQNNVSIWDAPFRYNDNIVNIWITILRIYYPCTIRVFERAFKWRAPHEVFLKKVVPFQISSSYKLSKMAFLLQEFKEHLFRFLSFFINYFANLVYNFIQSI